MVNKIRLLATACLASFCLTDFSTASASSELRMRLVADPQTFDWNLAHTVMETPVVMNIMEGLVAFDKNMNVVPQLAKSWTVSPDQKTYTFKLRDGVKWSDGKLLAAQDFIYSWKRLIDPLTAAPYAYLLFDVDGAEDYHARRISDFSKVAVKALDASTVQVRLKRPVAYFLQIFTFWVTFPARQDLIEKFGVNWTKPEKIAVVGPYIPSAYQPQTQLILKRNQNYYGRQPKVDTVVFKFINEDTTALNLFNTGQLDYTRPINFLEMGTLASSPAFHNDPYYRTCFLSINTTKYPFNLPKMRQAIAMAIDKSNLAKAMHLSIKASNTFVHEKVFEEGQAIGLKYNPTEAKRLMQEVGLTPATAPRIEFIAYSSDTNALVAQYIQDQLKKNLGLNVDIQMPEFKMYRTQLELQTSNMYYRCWGADYSDPDAFLAIFLSTSGNNKTGWKNSRYDELIRTAAATPNGPTRTKLYKEALDLLLVKESAVVPLMQDSLTYLLNPKVKNFFINPLNYIYIRDVEFAK